MSGKTVSKVICLYVSDPKGVQAYADGVKQYVKNTAINRAEGSEIFIFSKNESQQQREVLVNLFQKVAEHEAEPRTDARVGSDVFPQENGGV